MTRIIQLNKDKIAVIDSGEFMYNTHFTQRMRNTLIKTSCCKRSRRRKYTHQNKAGYREDVGIKGGVWCNKGHGCNVEKPKRRKARCRKCGHSWLLRG